MNVRSNVENAGNLSANQRSSADTRSHVRTVWTSDQVSTQWVKPSSYWQFCWRFSPPGICDWISTCNDAKDLSTSERRFELIHSFASARKTKSLVRDVLQTFYNFAETSRCQVVFALLCRQIVTGFQTYLPTNQQLINTSYEWQISVKSFILTKEWESAYYIKGTVQPFEWWFLRRISAFLIEKN